MFCVEEAINMNGDDAYKLGYQIGLQNPINTPATQVTPPVALSTGQIALFRLGFRDGAKRKRIYFRGR